MWTKPIAMQHDILNNTRASRSGVALLTALSLLALFIALGTVYLRYADLETGQADFDMRKARVRHAAANGIQAAIAEIQAAGATGRDALQQNYDFEFPVYGKDQHAALGFSPKDTRRALARVTVIDESGKINLAHAPARLLKKIFGINGAKARAIVQTRPAPALTDDDMNGQRGWPFSVDSMVASELIDRAMAEAVDESMLTFHSVWDHAKPAAYWNINAAAVQAIEAALGVSSEVASAVAAAKPFSSVEQVAAAAGKKVNRLLLPAEAISFTSRCFRIRCAASYANIITDSAGVKKPHRVSNYNVEAVIVLDSTDEVRIGLWNEGVQWDQDMPRIAAEPQQEPAA